MTSPTPNRGGPDRWKHVLEREGFHDVALYSDIEKNDASCQSVILARNEKLDLTNKVLEESPKLGKADYQNQGR